MQLASQTGDPDQKMPPSIYAALIDSLFQDPGPLFAGALCAAVGAIMTAVKTGNPWLWPCVALVVVTGAVRALDTRQYRQSNSGLTSNEAARWEVRYQFGAMLYAAGQQRCGRAHVLPIRHALLRGGRRLSTLRPPVDLSCANAAGLRTADAGAGAVWKSVLFRDGGPERTVLPRPQTHLDQPAEDFRTGAGCARARGGTGEPVRHRLEQHAARPVHVSRGRPACRRQSSLHRNDEPVR